MSHAGDAKFEGADFAAALENVSDHPLLDEGHDAKKPVFEGINERLDRGILGIDDPGKEDDTKEEKE